MSLIAINVLLEPDAATIEKARAVNARLRESYPAGFALDESHTPHITLFQCFVPVQELKATATAVSQALPAEQPAEWQSRASGYYALKHENLGLVGIVFEATDVLRRLQQRVIDAVAPFAAKNGTGDAFAPRADGAAIGSSTVDYVNGFAARHTGTNYHPHLTVGIGTLDFVDALKAEPFETFTFRAVSVSLYQIGDYGVAQKKLHDIRRC